jgi:hypothetical protein
MPESTTLHPNLTEAQTDGLACVVCGEDYTVSPAAAVPVDVHAGGQLFACEGRCAARWCVVCGPGCVAPTPGVHTSCPGPLVGRTVESVR